MRVCSATGTTTCAGGSTRCGRSRPPPKSSRATRPKSSPSGGPRQAERRSCQDMKQQLFTLVKLLVSIGLLAFLVAKVGLADIISIATSADYRYLVAAIVLWFGSVFFSVWKWQLMLNAQGIAVPFRALLAHYYIGLFFNNFLPMVGQDVVRGYGIARYTERAHEVAVSVLVDRLVGLIAFIVGGAVMSVV